MGRRDHGLAVKGAHPGQGIEEEVDPVDMYDIGVGDMTEHAWCDRIAA